MNDDTCLMLTRGKIFLKVLISICCASAGTAGLSAQTPSSPTSAASKPFPLNFDFNFGGMVPSGETGQAYSKSILVGGGVNLPIKRWISFDLITIDAGFGTAGGSRIITLTDKSTRSTANYSAQLMSGPRVMIPMKRGGDGRLEFGFGWAGIEHREYGVGNVSYAGTTKITEQIICPSCFSTFGSGYYGLVQLGVRTKYSRGGGVFVKWIEVLDNGKGFSPQVQFPKEQRWITFGVNITFGFGG